MGVGGRRSRFAAGGLGETAEPRPGAPDTGAPRRCGLGSTSAAGIGSSRLRRGRAIADPSARLVQLLGGPPRRADCRRVGPQGTWDRQLARYTAPDLLIIDDLGLRPLTGDEPMDLYEVIRQRYERGSIIITSNRDVTEWYPLFGDDLLASAAMDRLLHHSHVVTLEGRSYRTAAA